MKKVRLILRNVAPILLMIGLIPLITNDYVLTLMYVVIIAIAFFLRRMPQDALVLVLGFFIMILAEYLFVSTGVETFTRRTLLGVMPLWLPFLWSYGFVAIKRSVMILS